MWAPVLQIGALELLVILVVFGVPALLVLIASVIGYKVLTDKNDGDETGVAAGSRDPALQTLRERYAAGELTDEEYERRRETLLRDDEN
ncbi:SHOCT domain-containing protein [Haloarchaeobius sp. TZWWS8]|uniref:SHOCT domain-containing protein n=1 Tax=Haloarchaeobius sp. TZWWS8 TaxID=3446121 RepID=UPI003EB7359F